MIYIVLVNWKRYADTIECLESLLRMKGDNFRVIVVDNESSASGIDEMTAWVARPETERPSGPPWHCLDDRRRFDPSVAVVSSEDSNGPLEAAWLTVVRNRENSGFAGGCNIGIRLAFRDPACSHIWLLNNDTVVAPDALETLIARAAGNSEIGAIASTLLYYDTPFIIQSLGGQFNFWLGKVRNIGQGENVESLNSSRFAKAHRDYLVGASLLVSRKLFETVGLLSERYFLYFEELDLIRRSRKLFKFVWESKSIVYHKEGASIGTNSRGRPSDITLYYYNLNFIRFTAKFNVLALPFVISKCLALYIAYAAIGDRRASRAIGYSLAAFLKGLPAETLGFVVAQKG